MSDKELINQRIDNYLLGNMTETETNEFISELDQNESLVKDYKIRKAQKEAIEAYGRNTLKAELKVIHKKLEIEDSGQNSKRKLYRWVFKAALLVGLTALGYNLWNNNTPENVEPAQLFADNYVPYKASSSRDIKSTKDSIDIKMLLSYKLYKEKQYAEATPVFESLINDHASGLTELNIMLGVSYMESGEIKKSQKQFLDIIEKDDINFKDEATWQLAFSYLKEKNIIKSKESFKILATDEDSDFHEKAKILLEYLQQ